MMRRDEKVNASERIVMSSEYWNSLDLAQVDTGIVTHDFFSEGKYTKQEINFPLRSELISKLNKLTNQNDLPFYMVFLTGLQIQLFKYTGKEENIVGIPAYVGNVKDNITVKNKVLPLFSKVIKEASVKHLLKEVQENLFKAYENQYCDLDHLLKSSYGGTGVMDLTPVSISMNTLHREEFIDYISNSPKNQLSVCINKKDSQTYDLSFIYNAELYNKETLTLFGERFIRIVNEIVRDLDQTIKQIEVITEEGKVELLQHYNHTFVDYPSKKTVQELFEAQVEKTPQSIAVKYENQVLTYQELNEKANQLARLLKSRGVTTDSVVAIMVNGSIEMVIAIMGVLKAGGAYLPIDIHHPSGRKEYMLQDAEVDIIISRQDLMTDIQFSGSVIDIFDGEIFQGDKTNLDIERSSSDLAYVIYTSGTTGNPKGVMIEHKSLINYVYYCKDRYLEEGKGDFPLYTSISFDLTVTSIYVPLLSGNKVCVYNNDNQFSFTHIVEDPIDVMKLTPAHLSVINGLDLNNVSISRFIVGGEELSYQLTEDIHRKFNGNVEIINEYGPTEATVGCIVYKYRERNKREKSLPIGTPIHNSRVYILDEELNLVPKGVPGDLWIAGDGLARGYLNKPEMTSEKFVEAPFNPEERMYKTGDIARWKLDGTIEFFGRKDNQVKVRGFRIELGEIENSLLSHQDIKEAVVLARESEKQEKYLTAYVTGRGQLDISEIKDYLKETVPYYMVPSYIMQLESMPLTTNGKIDRNILPEPYFIGGGSEYVAPRNDIEHKLAEVWSEVLGAERIGIRDNFFDLGGDSIKAIRITSKLQKYGYKLEVKDLFNFGTIQEVSDKVTTYSTVISQEEVTGEAPLTPIQRLFFENNFSNMHHWNQSVMIYNKEGFHEKAIECVLNELTKHHDALRMVYQKDKKTIKQVIRSSETKLIDLQVMDYRLYGNYEEMIEKCSEEIQSSIDLENGPLVKAGLFKTSEGDHLLIAIHHLVVDGVSWRILFEDFVEGYNRALKGEKIVFQSKTHSFKDWGLYLQQQAQSELLQNEIPYWEGLEKANCKLLKTDYEYSEESSKQKYVKSVDIQLSKEETEELLKNTNRAYNTEINDILLTALGLTVQEWTSEEQVLINLEGHGREKIEGDIDISRTIGWFTTHYPVLLMMKKEKKLSYFIKYVKETLRNVPNKGIGYGILAYLREGSAIKNIKPQISFNYLGQFDETVHHESLELSNLAKGNSISPEAESLYDIDINGTLVDHRLGFTFAYSSQKYNQSTMRRLAEAYKKYLLAIIHHCREQEMVELSPSDYSANDLTLDELEELKEKYKEFTIQDIYPLTPMQEGMLFHSLIDADSQAYFEQKSFTSKGGIDLEILEQSFNKLIERYDVLRTIIIHENVKTPKQVIVEKRKTSIHYEDISGLTEEQKSEYINRFQLEDRKRGFKLSEDILLRMSVIKVNHEEYKVIWSSHHILMDGWCSGIIMKDFFALYSAEKNNHNISLKTPTPYVNYINWLQKQPKQTAKNYWEKYVDGYVNHAQFPGSVLKTSAQFNKEKLEFHVDKKITESLLKVSKQAQVTINTVIQTAWGILLQKYTGLNDVVFGSVVSGRNAVVDGIEEMIGLFINTIPIRIKNDTATNFIELVKAIQKDSLESTKYDYYPLAEIQSLSEAKQKLVNHILVFQNYYVDDEVMESNSLVDFEITDVTLYEQNNYDLGVMVLPNDELTVRFSYNSNVYDSNSMNRLKDHFIRIMEIISDNPAVTVSDIDITTDDERHQLLEEFNKTQVDYSRGKTLQELFEAQVDERPDH
ncbi:amino acid adenylation domain-containing protein, partial [Bacillus cereus]|uniref:amino acid adenylation domain-containing protein n=1 Tax=Bacillus cereus TaxID=1396 RepID=UPI0039817624